MAAQSSKYYSLHYQYVPDILEKRGPHREGHLAAARKQVITLHAPHSPLCVCALQVVFTLQA